MEQEAKGQMIVKANKLVQAKMPLTKLEHRVVAMLISQLNREDEEFEFQKLRIRDLKAASDQKELGSLYQRAEKICSSLLEKKLEIKTEENGKRVYDGISLMNRCRYKEGDGYIEAKFNEEMKPYLLQLKRRFTMYEAGYYVPLRSTHSMRIYELLKMREGVSVLRISVSELRDILGLEDKYEYFSHLEHHVIQKAQEEVSEKTDVSFTYDKEREGRSVKRVKFFIHSEGDHPTESKRFGGERSETEELSREEPVQDEADRKMKIEDRTEAPDIDVMNLFLSDLTQEEIDNLSQETLDRIHQRAVEKVEREEPGGSKVLKQSLTLQHMKTLWEK
ncbi:replication initiation protein [Salinibacter altiplanensis]|uniref:replication initiation protein n=1 Tax=Salinibacter altiplanensis TaxID=1803181 RepID=UPI000C9F755F|nr:replication initiation protein [Salinibacter altiplanensis]